MFEFVTFLFLLFIKLIMFKPNLFFEFHGRKQDYCSHIRHVYVKPCTRKQDRVVLKTKLLNHIYF